MHPTAQKFAILAQEYGLNIAVQEYADGARTAEEAAAAVGCGVAQIVKSLLFVVHDTPTVVLVSGVNRLDEKKLAALCGVGRKQIRRSNADTAREVKVSYEGILPDLFDEGQGAVASGVLGEDGVLRATEVLAKHDENYMPPEVAEALEKSGYDHKGIKQ